MTTQPQQSGDEVDDRTRSGANPLNEMLVSVGQRVRDHRREQNLTLQGLASQAGLSASMISAVERGQTGATLATIHAIARALDIDVRELFGTGTPEKPVIPLAGQPRDFALGGAERRLVVADPDRHVEFYIYDFEPGTAHNSTPSRHRGVEYGLVLSGSLTVFIDNTEHHMATGDAIHFSGETGHLIKNSSSEPARAVWFNLNRV